MRKLAAGEYDAVVLAEAGLERLSIQLPGVRLFPRTNLSRHPTRVPLQSSVALTHRFRKQ